MTAQARREKRKRELSGSILDAAREIFVQEGYESFSMRKLAAKIGYSPGSIYLHFKNKEALFASLVDESFARLLKVLQLLRKEEGADSLAALRKGLHKYVEFGLRNPNDYRFAFLLKPPVEKRPYHVHAAFQELLYTVGLCAEEQRLPGLDVEMTSQAIWAAVHGITSLLIQRPTFPWVRKKELVAQVINHATECLAGKPAGTEKKGVRHASVGRSY
jgi:AcrR family transcriptional regulator